MHHMSLPHRGKRFVENHIPPHHTAPRSGRAPSNNRKALSKQSFPSPAKKSPEHLQSAKSCTKCLLRLPRTFWGSSKKLHNTVNSPLHFPKRGCCIRQRPNTAGVI